MKILVVSPKNKTVYNFRGDLIKDMIAKGHEVYVTGPNRLFYDEVMALGIKEFIEIPLVKDNTNPFGDIKYMKKLKACMKKIKPDMVFGYTIKPVIYGSLAAASAGVPRICGMITGLGRVYSAGGAKARLVRSVTVKLYRKALKKCDKVIFQNPDDRDLMVKISKIAPEKTTVVNGSGVNMNRFRREKQPEALSFLMVSRIIREKGVLDYCKAAKLVKAEHPQVRFVLLGGFDRSIGRLAPEDLAEYTDSGIVELPGEVKDPVGFYKNCSVYVLPSYYREGLPRTLLEAMACGCPVITTDWPGCREVVEEGSNGYLIPIKSPEILAERMKAFIEQPSLVKKMGDRSLELCLEKYEVSKVNRQMRDALGY